MIKAESLAGKIRLGEGEINALIRVLESEGEDETVDAFERICASALRQLLSDIEKLNEEIIQQRKIIRYNDDEVARLSACQIDADRYQWLRNCHEGQIGERHATVVMWADEPWEPKDGCILDQAIDIARTKASAGEAE